MAVVRTMPSQQISSLRYPDEAVIPPLMASRRETAEEAQGSNDKVYVAVGKDLDDSKLTLSWALNNFRGKKICILHVHQPAQKIPLMGTKFPVSQLEDGQVRAYREIEREDMDKLLRYYSMICNHEGVHPDLLHIEAQDIERGIVKLISQHGIRKLVMGAAADKRYSKNMNEPKSKKALFLRLHAPDFCQISFICKGRLVYTRQSRSDGISTGFGSRTLQASPNSGTGELSPFRSHSAAERNHDHLNTMGGGRDLRRVQSDNPWMKVSTSSRGFSGGLNPATRSGENGSFGELDGISRGSSSLNSRSSCSSLDVAECSGLASSPRVEPLLKLHALNHTEDQHLHSSPPSVLDGVKDDEVYDQLEQAMAEVEISKKDAFEESMRRRKAEKNALEAIRKVKTLETLRSDELRQRKDMDEALANRKEELKNMKQQVDEVMAELHTAMEQESYLQSQIVNSSQVVQELEGKMFSAVELLQKYKKERDELQLERDYALQVAEEFRKRLEESSETLVPQFFSEFSFSEIEEATGNFDPSLKIGEGGYGSIYRGILRHTEVAIKMLHSHSLQGPSEFQQEVAKLGTLVYEKLERKRNIKDIEQPPLFTELLGTIQVNILSKLRHPNLVTLIGACPEDCILVYEYVPNGSLEDRLNCRDNTSPLSWQIRIRIATELCSVLIFLHSCNSHSIVHGDIKPANILLDSNFVSKLSDFGICRVLTEGEFSSNNTLCRRTDPKGTLVYIDPEFLATGELTPKSDVYSFGIILLRLLTGKPALGLAKEVQLALENGNLNELLDPTAGDWPFVLAKQLAHLAIRCCEMNRRSRPDLSTEVWRTLEPMRVSCGAPSFRMSSEERRPVPPYFICPIFQEIMQDPHVAADGYTYELEALKGWLDSGHETSPMTNLKLSHQNLIPNHALRSAIQEWLQSHE